MGNQTYICVHRKQRTGNEWREPVVIHYPKPRLLFPSPSDLHLLITQKSGRWRLGTLPNIPFRFLNAKDTRSAVYTRAISVHCRRAHRDASSGRGNSSATQRKTKNMCTSEQHFYDDLFDINHRLARSQRPPKVKGKVSQMLSCRMVLIRHRQENQNHLQHQSYALHPEYFVLIALRSDSLQSPRCFSASEMHCDRLVIQRGSQ